MDTRTEVETQCAGTRTLRVLLVSPYFAPSTAVGAKRFSYLAEQFEHLGCSVETLTTRLNRGDRPDATLPRPGRVHPIGTLLPYEIEGRGLFARAYDRLTKSVIGVPDHYIGWLPTSIVAGRRIARRARPDVIIATGPPFTAFLTGAFLRRATGARLILDYRDPWTAFEWPDTRFGRIRMGRLSRSMEQWAVKSASALVFTTELMRERFEANYRGPKPNCLRVLTNGFNEPGDLQPESLTSGAINILYAGSFYGERRLAVLMDALGRLKLRTAYRDRRFAVHVFGRVNANDKANITQMGLDNCVHEYAQVDHKTVLGFMKAADVLYLPSGGDVTYALPFKVFDYLSVCRPILAVTPAESAVAQFVLQNDCGEVADADSAECIAAALERILTRQRPFSYAGRERFTWKAVARRYVQLIHMLGESDV